jgi:acyl-ACP thioesterase
LLPVRGQLLPAARSVLDESGPEVRVALVSNDLIPLPSTGRVYRAERRVRLGDTSPEGRLRFDSVARYLQDVAEDDAEDAQWPASIGWLLRRCVVAVWRFPSRTERLELATFCSATASRWAERTTTIRGDDGGLVQAKAIWVAVDAVSGRPQRLGELFERVYRPSAGGKSASARLLLPGPPEFGLEPGRPWPVRASDIDIWGHMNNAVHWAAVEDAMSSLDWLPVRAELEYNEPIVSQADPVLLRQETPSVLDTWLLGGGRVLASARLWRSPGSAGTRRDP